VADIAARSGPRFDSLVHVTRDGRWTTGRHDASYARLVAELDRARVERACLVGLPGVVDNEYVLECAAASGGRLVPIAGVNPVEFAAPDALPSRIAALARSGFVGIKLHPRLNGFDPLDERSIAAIQAAASGRLVVFLDTLFRQRALAARHAADTIDALVHACPSASIVLLHGGGPALLDVAEIVRVNPALVLDLSFTTLYYSGSSLERDVRWVMERLDQRVVIGSDMPEFTPAETFEYAERLADTLSAEKWANIAHRNLDRLFPVRAGAAAATRH
jgi:predicted TIM-barrel fold metal-dependent hydrolase